MKRKTIEIEYLKEFINSRLANESVLQEEKAALTELLSHILRKTNNYNGYSYLFDFNALTETESNKIRYNRKYY